MLRLCIALSLTLLAGAGAAPAAVASTAGVDAKVPVTPAYVDKLTSGNLRMENGGDDSTPLTGAGKS